MGALNVEKEAYLFSYHKQSGYPGFIGAMIFVTVLEAVGVSFFLYKWNPVIHWIHLILSISVIVGLIFDLKAVINNPIAIKKEELLLKIGMRPRVTIDIKNIKEIKSGNINYENDKKNKEVLNLSLLGFEAPAFELVLNKPIENKALFGKSRDITRVFFTVDDKDSFYNIISK